MEIFRKKKGSMDSNPCQCVYFLLFPKKDFNRPVISLPHITNCSLTQQPPQYQRKYKHSIFLIKILFRSIPKKILNILTTKRV